MKRHPLCVILYIADPCHYPQTFRTPASYVWAGKKADYFYHLLHKSNSYH